MKDFFDAINACLIINMTVIYVYKNNVFDTHSLNVCDIEETDEYIEFFNAEDSMVRISRNSTCKQTSEKSWELTNGDLTISVILDDLT